MNDTWGKGEVAALRAAGKAAMEMAESDYRAVVGLVNKDDITTLSLDIATARKAWAAIWQELDVLHADAPGPRSRDLVRMLVGQIEACTASIGDVASHNGIITIKHLPGGEGKSTMAASISFAVTGHFVGEDEDGGMSFDSDGNPRGRP